LVGGISIRDIFEGGRFDFMEVELDTLVYFWLLHQNTRFLL